MKAFLAVLVGMAAACGSRPADARAAGRVRPAAKAGTWYPADPAKLRKQIRGYLARAPKANLGGPVVALISPHAGYRFSGRCAGAGYALLRGRDVRRVIILAPSHHVGFHGASIADVDAYATPLGNVPLDRKACDAILKSSLVRSIPAVHRDEHSLELQLPFLQVVLGKFQLVPLILGRLRDDEFQKLARVLREYLDAHTVVVASSDFTHFGRAFRFVPFVRDVRASIEKLDKGAVARIVRLDSAGFRKYTRDTGATICGRVPIAVLLEMLTPDCRGRLLEYYLSGDLEGRYEHTVSYASIGFAVGPGEVSPAGQKILLDIARKTLRATLRNQPLPDFDVKDKELLVRRGVFVTYKNHGRLRGCIGNFQPRLPLWKTVRAMAFASARHDTRFARNPITAREEPDIDITISILSPMRRIRDPLNFIPGIHGLYVRRGPRAGTYLPQVAEELGVGRLGFIAHLCKYKAGIGADAWKDKDTEVYIYSAQVFGDAKKK